MLLVREELFVLWDAFYPVVDLVVVTERRSIPFDESRKLVGWNREANVINDCKIVIGRDFVKIEEVEVDHQVLGCTRGERVEPFVTHLRVVGERIEFRVCRILEVFDIFEERDSPPEWAISEVDWGRKKWRGLRVRAYCLLVLPHQSKLSGKHGSLVVLPHFLGHRQAEWSENCGFVIESDFACVEVLEREPLVRRAITFVKSQLE